MNGLYEITPRAGVSDGAVAAAFDGAGSGSGEAAFEVRVAEDHDVFRGHFPGNPVLPGVCSMMIVRECASRMVGRPLHYATIAECKFTAAIAPGDILAVGLKLAAEGETYAVTATVRNSDINALKIKAKLTPNE